VLARIGLSNATSEQVDAASRIARVDAVQNRFSPLEQSNLGLLLRCAEVAMPFFAYSPLGGLAAPGRLAATMPRTARLAQQRGMSLARLTLRGLLALSPVMSVVSGARRPPTAADSAHAETDPWDTELRAAFDADLAAQANLIG
jgi:Predicted oxidoreductases (related to aryl-alcohol dehydrogenases)